MSNFSRAARQLLRDWQFAGLTHLPHIALEPISVAEPLHNSPELKQSPRPAAVSPARSAPSSNLTVMREAMNPSREAQRPVVQHSKTPASNLVENTDSLPVRQQKLEQLASCVAGCTRCPELAQTRKKTVFGIGNPQAKVMFIGEAPGADEDRTGEPFVGKAGQLLTKIIEACGWTREEIYICNILRCRPPDNRLPTEREAQNCREYLDGQIATVDPQYIVCWGSCAAQNLLGTKDAIGKMRQRFFEHGRAKVLCTYHPSYLLRNPAAKKPVWDDMKLLLAEMGLTPPTR